MKKSIFGYDYFFKKYIYRNKFGGTIFVCVCVCVRIKNNDIYIDFA